MNFFIQCSSFFCCKQVIDPSYSSLCPSVFFLVCVKRWCSPPLHCGPRKQDGVDNREGQLGQEPVYGWHQHRHRTSSGGRLARVPCLDKPGQRDHWGLPQGDPRFPGEENVLKTFGWINQKRKINLPDCRIIFQRSIPQILISFCSLGLIWRRLVTKMYWQTLLWLRYHCWLLWPAVCDVLWWTEPDHGGLYCNGKCPTHSNTEWFVFNLIYI